MKKFLVLSALVFAVSCGAQGEPIRPSANVGLNIGPDGVTPSVSAGAQSGPFTFGVKL